MNILNWNSHEIEIGDFLARLMAAVWTRGNNWNQRPAKKKSIKTKMIVKWAITLFIRKRVYVRRRWKERKSSARWLTELVNVVKRLKTKLRVHKTRAICDRCGYFPSAKEKVFFFDLNEWKLIGRAGHVTGFFNEKSDKFHFFCLANRKLCLLSVCSRNNSRPCTKRRLPLRCTCRRVVRLPSDPLKVTVSFIFSLNSFFF